MKSYQFSEAELTREDLMKAASKAKLGRDAALARVKNLVPTAEFTKEVEALIEQAYQIGQSEAWKEIKAMQRAILEASETAPQVEDPTK